MAPPARRRASSALTLAEREDISRGIASGATFRSIAARLGRAPSTVSREVARSGGWLRYRATMSVYNLICRSKYTLMCRSEKAASTC